MAFDPSNLPNAQREARDENRSVLQNGVRQLGLIVQALQALAGATVGVSTVSGLPTAATAGQGARRTVTDATVTTFASVVAGGGTNIVPVYSDGTNWRIG